MTSSRKAYCRDQTFLVSVTDDGPSNKTHKDTYNISFTVNSENKNLIYDWDGSTHYRRLILWNDGGYILQEKKYCVVPLFTTVDDKVRNKNNSASAIDC